MVSVAQDLTARLLGLTVESDAEQVNSWAYTTGTGRELSGPAAYLAERGPFVFIEEPVITGVGRVGEYWQYDLLCYAPTLPEARALADAVQGRLIRPGSPWRLVGRQRPTRTDIGTELQLTFSHTWTAFRT